MIDKLLRINFIIILSCVSYSSAGPNFPDIPLFGRPPPAAGDVGRIDARMALVRNRFRKAAGAGAHRDRH